MDKSQLYYGVAKSHLDGQYIRKAQLESRAGFAFGLGTLFLGIAALVSPWSNGLSLYLAAGLVGVFLLVGLLSLDVFRIRDFMRSPNLNEMAEYLPDYEDAAMTEWASEPVNITDLFLGSIRVTPESYVASKEPAAAWPSKSGHVGPILEAQVGQRRIRGQPKGWPCS